MPLAAIVDCDGPALGAEERALFADADPWGFILFERNCETPDQIRRLCADLRAAVGRADAPILIDQEGGRVARLKPPQWPSRAPMAVFGAVFAEEREKGRQALWLSVRLQADELANLGVNVNCAPVLDIPQPGAHDVIGDRAFASQPETVAALGRAAMEGFLAGGVLPVIKHIPGHGRAMVDSHAQLPVVAADADMLRVVDFAPFRDLRDAPMAMTAHVVYAAYDPDRPATTSPRVMQDVIRGEIGYDGLVMTDALTMKALRGAPAENARAALAAGCDVVLHCDGWNLMSLAAKREVLDVTPALSGDAKRRADAALARLHQPAPFDRAEAERVLANLLPAALA